MRKEEDHKNTLSVIRQGIFYAVQTVRCVKNRNKGGLLLFY
ncbi:hypothetical protein D2M30_1704 [Bacillus amyloliquefaciens]|nr:hypothetical protein D2M30_1704 [Bacillus amyloliquefaciens]